MSKPESVYVPSRIMAVAETRRILALALLALFLGCGHPGGHLPEGSYERGLAEYEGGAVLEAIEDLKLFIRRNPQDPLAPDAQFMVGKSYMETQDYPVAAVEFEILQVDYPRSPLTDDAGYLEAMCYAKQVADYRLDQTSTELAVEKLTNYLRAHPTGKFVAEAQDELTKLQGVLDRKRYEAAAFYAGRGYYEASQRVLRNVMEDSPDSPIRPEMLLLMGDLEIKLGEFDSAERHLRELVDRWPDNRLAGSAEKRLDRLEKARHEDDS